MPHGGPWVRDVWEFDPLVQLLANRGYAVLQMNYRGSPGYGEELFQMARRQIGRPSRMTLKMAPGGPLPPVWRTRSTSQSWAPATAATRALFALGHNPELYRCGISMAGVTDWAAIYDDRRGDPDARDANKYWRRENW